MQQEILEQHLQLFTVVFEMISSLLLELYFYYVAITSIDRIIKMYPLHVRITMAGSSYCDISKDENVR